MAGFVLDFADIDKDSLALAGGKGANLGELCRIPGVAVPAGFAVTTEAYAAFTATSRKLPGLLAELRGVDAAAREEIGRLGSRIRTHLAGLEIASEIYYPVPLHQQECFKCYGPHPALPVAETLAREVISVPVFPELTAEEHHAVAEAIASWCQIQGKGQGK
jgi:pyruvate,water dikinase